MATLGIVKYESSTGVKGSGTVIDAIDALMVCTLPVIIAGR